MLLPNAQLIDSSLEAFFTLGKVEVQVVRVAKCKYNSQFFGHSSVSRHCHSCFWPPVFTLTLFTHAFGIAHQYSPRRSGIWSSVSISAADRLTCRLQAQAQKSVAVANEV